jgi:hypothetical protein
MSWDEAVKIVTPHVVRIETPTGWGTGFLAFYNHDSSWCGIATAAHVVSHADEWQELIKIRNAASPNPRFLKSEDRVIFVDYRTDSAVVLFLKSDLQLPQSPIALMQWASRAASGPILAGWVFPTWNPTYFAFSPAR